MNEQMCIDTTLDKIQLWIRAEHATENVPQISFTIIQVPPPETRNSSDSKPNQSWAAQRNALLPNLLPLPLSSGICSKRSGFCEVWREGVFPSLLPPQLSVWCKSFEAAINALKASIFFSLLAGASYLWIKDMVRLYGIPDPALKDLKTLSLAAAFMADTSADAILWDARALAADVVVPVVPGYGIRMWMQRLRLWSLGSLSVAFSWRDR